MLFGGLARDFADKDRIDLWLEGDYADVCGVAFVSRTCETETQEGYANRTFRRQSLDLQ